MAIGKATGTPFRPGSWSFRGAGQDWPLPPGYDDGYVNMAQWLIGDPAEDNTPADKLTNYALPTYVNNMCYTPLLSDVLRFLDINEPPVGSTVENSGTSVWSIAGKDLTCTTAGTAWDIIVKESGGAVWAHITGTDNGDTFFDSSGARHAGTKVYFIGSSSTTFHGYSDLAPATNINRGFRNIPTTLLQTLEGPSPDGIYAGQTFGTEKVKLVESNGFLPKTSSNQTHGAIGTFAGAPDTLHISATFIYALNGSQTAQTIGSICSSPYTSGNFSGGLALNATLFIAYWHIGGVQQATLKFDRSITGFNVGDVIDMDTFYSKVTGTITLRARLHGDPTWPYQHSIAGITGNIDYGYANQKIGLGMFDLWPTNLIGYPSPILSLEISEYDTGTIVAQYHPAYGGPTVFDVSGNGNDLTPRTASDWTTQDVVHHNYLKGCSPILENPVSTTSSNYINLGRIIGPTDDFSIVITVSDMRQGGASCGLQNSNGTGRCMMYSATGSAFTVYYGTIYIIGDIVPVTDALTKLYFSKVGNTIYQHVEGGAEHSLGAAGQTSGNQDFWLGGANQWATRLNGRIHALEVEVNGVPVVNGFPYEGGFFNKLNGVHSLIVGTSLSQYYVPALEDETVDARGNPITHPGGVTHNACETKLLQSEVINPSPIPSSYENLFNETSNRVAVLKDRNVPNWPVIQVNVYDEGGETDIIIPALLDGSAAANDQSITRPGGYLHNGTYGSDILQSDAYFLTGPNFWTQDELGLVIVARTVYEIRDHVAGGLNLWVRWGSIDILSDTGGLSHGCVLEETCQYNLGYVLPAGEILRADEYFTTCSPP